MRKLVRTERPVAVHDLRARVEVRPDAEPVEPEGLHQVQIGDHVRRAHAAEVRDEGQKLRLTVDCEALAVDAKSLSPSVARTDEKGERADEVAERGCVAVEVWF